MGQYAYFVWLPRADVCPLLFVKDTVVNASVLPTEERVSDSAL